MRGLLTYRDEQIEGFDLINLADLFFHALGYILEEVGLEFGIEIGLELLAALLEVLAVL
jgi:hypothetical protein